MKRVRAAIAGIAGCSAAVAFYAILRLVQRLRSPDPDPALVLWSEHSGFFWRALTAGYVGGMVAFVVFLAARDLTRTARTVRASLALATVLATLQGLLVP